MEHRLEELESKHEESDKRVKSNTAEGRRVSQQVKDLQGKMETLSQHVHSQENKGTPQVHFMIGQAETVNVYNQPPPVQPTHRLPIPPVQPTHRLPIPPVAGSAIHHNTHTMELCKHDLPVCLSECCLIL